MAHLKVKSDEQKAAEANVERFRRDLGPFVVAAEHTRMPMVFTDARARDNPIIFANDAFLTLSGYGRDEVLGQNFNFLLASGADPDALAKIDAEFKGTTDCGSEHRYRRKDGSEFWATTCITPVRDEMDSIVQHFASFVDSTRHEQAQTHSRMLIEELNHRVKNTLSTVQSIVDQVLRRETDSAVIRRSIESRLFALSRSHELLTRENWVGAGLYDLVGAALEPFGIAGARTERFQVAGANLRVSPKTALALGIAFHELATNAEKFGALSNDAGSVRISWSFADAAGEQRLVLRWREKDGPPVAPPTRKGFGSQVLERGLAHELEGSVRLDFAPSGLTCTIDMPAPSSTLHG